MAWLRAAHASIMGQAADEPQRRAGAV